MDVLVGVDEAGKGPVLGSMFAAAVCVTDRSSLPDGIRDSKRLSADRRDRLASTMVEDGRIALGTVEVPPERIDDPQTDMNSLTVTAHAEAIQSALDERTSGTQTNESPPRCICDACDTDADRFARRVAAACDIDVSVTARHGADDDDPLVGAASVIAKIERDAQIDRLRNQYGDVGSGYPSDPTTRAFLESYVAETGTIPPFARRSWSTCSDVLAAATQTGLEDF